MATNWYYPPSSRSNLPGAGQFAGIANAMAQLMASQETPAQTAQRRQANAMNKLRQEQQKQQMELAQKADMRAFAELELQKAMNEANVNYRNSETVLNNQRLSGRGSLADAFKTGDLGNVLGSLAQGDQLNAGNINILNRSLMAQNPNVSDEDLFKFRSALGDNLNTNSAVSLNQQNNMRNQDIASAFARMVGQEQVQNQGAMDRLKYQTENKPLTIGQGDIAILPDGNVVRGMNTENTLSAMIAEKVAQGNATQGEMDVYNRLNPDKSKSNNAKFDDIKNIEVYWAINQGVDPDDVQSELSDIDPALRFKAQQSADSVLSSGGSFTEALQAYDRSINSQANTTTTQNNIVEISSDSEYDSLPSGAMFRGPDGKVRRKP